MVYLLTCLWCKGQGVKSLYHGETARSGYRRGQEHQRALRAKDPDSSLTRHWEEVHKESPSPPDFSMSILKTYTKSLERQIAESCFIMMTEADYILNAKNEWNGSMIPQLTTEMRGQAAPEEYQGAQPGLKAGDPQCQVPEEEGIKPDGGRRPSKWRAPNGSGQPSTNFNQSSTRVLLHQRKREVKSSQQVQFQQTTSLQSRC